jgi:hypothetical protein
MSEKWRFATSIWIGRLAATDPMNPADIKAIALFKVGFLTMDLLLS